MNILVYDDHRSSISAFGLEEEGSDEYIYCVVCKTTCITIANPILNFYYENFIGFCDLSICFNCIKKAMKLVQNHN